MKGKQDKIEFIYTIAKKNKMKNFKIFMMALLLSLFIMSCNTLQTFSESDSVEYNLAKMYALHKLEKAFDTKIDVAKHFKAETNLSIEKVESIFGKQLTRKFTDSLSLVFENQRVRTSLVYIKKEDNRVLIRLDRKPKIN